MIPYTQFDAVSPSSIRSVSCWLDSVAIGPAALTLPSQLFDRRDLLVIVAWIWADRRHVDAFASFGTDAVRKIISDYSLALTTSGPGSLLVLYASPPGSFLVPGDQRALGCRWLRVQQSRRR